MSVLLDGNEYPNGTFYHGVDLDGNEISGILQGSETLILKQVFRKVEASSKADMDEVNASLAKAGNVGANGA